jgi:hypothetical protein
MYRDQENIQVIQSDYPQISAFIRDAQSKNLLIVGDEGSGRVQPGMRFDEWFYWQHGVDFSKRWSQFYVQRDSLESLNWHTKHLL